MREFDAIVVGGGPAGSTAAWQLRRGGLRVLVLDRERFPRLKLCAGWVTPDVLSDLEIDAAGYPHRLLSFSRLHFHLWGLHLPVACVQHSIRREEFDAWLLDRSGAQFEQHAVDKIDADPDGYVIDGRYRARFLVGAGGTSCPVYRTLFRKQQPRDRGLQTATLELEFPCEWRDGDCHLWFFDHGLPGYSWYVPKARGWLNVGVGAMAQLLRRRDGDLHEHWQHLVARLQRQFRVTVPQPPAGYSYFLRGPLRALRTGNALLAGDAAGLATRDLCEGIGPAVRSGLRAAEAILRDTPYDLSSLSATSLPGLAGRWLDRRFTRTAARA